MWRYWQVMSSRRLLSVFATVMLLSCAHNVEGPEPIHPTEPRVALSKSDCEISVHGEVNNVMSSKLQAVFARIETSKSMCDRWTIVLVSKGGFLYPAISIGELIRARGYGTRVPAESECSSACSVVFLGGVKREVSNSRGRLGLHQSIKTEPSQMSCLSHTTNNPASVALRSYVAKMLPRDAADYFLKESDKIHCKSIGYFFQKDLLGSKIVTH